MSPVCLVLLLLCTAVSGLEFLELNMTEAGRVEWDKLAMLPALHSLMLVPPISPHSSGHGPEHAQQVRLSRDSCCFRPAPPGRPPKNYHAVVVDMLLPPINPHSSGG
jgi:hypothetical protein